MATTSARTSPAALSVFPPQWGAVRQGLAWFAAGLTLVFLGLVIMFALFLSEVVRTGGQGGSTLLEIGHQVFPLVILLGGLAILIGQCLCCTVPGEAGVRVLAVGALACLVLGVVAGSLAPLFASPGDLDPRGNLGAAEFNRMRAEVLRRAALARTADPQSLLVRGMTSTQLLLSAVSFTLFACFLGGVARTLGSERLAAGVNAYLMYLVAAVAAVLGGRVTIDQINRHARLPVEASTWVRIALLAGLLTLIGLAFVWFLSLVLRTRRVVRKAQRTGEEAHVIEAQVVEA